MVGPLLLVLVVDRQERCEHVHSLLKGTVERGDKEHVRVLNPDAGTNGGSSIGQIHRADPATQQRTNVDGRCTGVVLGSTDDEQVRRVDQRPERVAIRWERLESDISQPQRRSADIRAWIQRLRLRWLRLQLAARVGRREQFLMPALCRRLLELQPPLVSPQLIALPDRQQGSPTPWVHVVHLCVDVLCTLWTPRATPPEPLGPGRMRSRSGARRFGLAFGNLATWGVPSLARAVSMMATATRRR